MLLPASSGLEGDAVDDVDDDGIAGYEWKLFDNLMVHVTQTPHL
jgi:hypothetical protein